MDGDIPRYSRHMLLKVIGDDGQKRIEESRALCGRPGSAWFGHREPAGTRRGRFSQDCGSGRAGTAQSPSADSVRRGRRSPRIAQSRCGRKSTSREPIPRFRSEAVAEAIGSQNVERLVGGVDLVVDALDNTATRYLVNDAILRAGIPYVFGGAVETVGNGHDHHFRERRPACVVSGRIRPRWKVMHAHQPWECFPLRLRA